jgi:hypothetical protein
MNIINEPRFFENIVRNTTPNIKETGDNYIKQQGVCNKKRKTPPKQLTEKDIRERNRNQYISCLNRGRIIKINIKKVIEYGIVFNEATQKYEKRNEVCYLNTINKLIIDNKDKWTDTFNPLTIINDAIAKNNTK